MNKKNENYAIKVEEQLISSGKAVVNVNVW